jgi:hypothetical protein
MGLIEYLVSRSFRDEKAGRVVVFKGVGRARGYLVGSQGEELRIRAFLRMYFFAALSIQMLGILVVCAWMAYLSDAMGRPSLERELTRGGIFLAAYALLVGLPLLCVWRAFPKALPSFVAPGNEVAVSRRPMDHTQRLFLGAALALATLVLAIIFLLGRAAH